MHFNPFKNKYGLLRISDRVVMSMLMILFANMNSDFLFNAVAQTKKMAAVSLGRNGRLVYTADSLGNRVPDFSYCGYMAGEKAIPGVPVRIVVPAIEGDATDRIQSAIDYVASLPLDPAGIRGAVLLDKGIFKVYGCLCIRASGIVLRGSGTGENGTALLGAGKERSTLISISGKNDLHTGPAYQIADSYVPVNAMRLRTDFAGSFNAGDRIMIKRPSTMNWIKDIHTEEFGGAIGWNDWEPGTRDLSWDRTILAIDGDRVTIDAPVTTAIDEKYGGGLITRYEWPGRISNTGIENLCLISAFDETNPKDEDHRWMAISMENAEDSWVRQVVFRHFAGSAVALYETSKRITVEDCKSLAPVSEIGGMRRNTFFTSGQQTLFQRCYAEYGYHDFAVGFCAGGPNAFVQCESHLPFSFSGSVDSWASGILFDVVSIDGNALSYVNLKQSMQGAGWNAANSVFWQCSASRMDCNSPPTATNWAFGSWAEFSGDGEWYESNNHIRPRSLYNRQLTERLGDHMPENAGLLPITNEACTSPTIEKANTYAGKAVRPCMTLSEWIDMAGERQPISTEHYGIISVDEINLKRTLRVGNLQSIEIVKGRLLCNGRLLTGNRIRNAYWRGDIRPHGISESSPHITRFVPGRTGKGLTDDLNEVAAWMVSRHIIAFEHHYGLWYDRRRDDHERIRRMDGDVWPPFYELPFARSGKETAWDGLSKYDLTKYNHWYWSRLKQFADLADQKGFLLIHQNYFQHNILEAGAHWADFPWRTANNINNTGFPEPPPYAGDKRIFMAELFYDVNQPVRRKIHQAYIRQCLDNFRDNHNVIQFISAEYTGPLSFTKFWIDVIRAWQEEAGRKVMVGLSTTKDVQDSILSDPLRSPEIDLIDIHYWQYREDGSLYAPEGGLNLAPRQHARLTDPGETSFREVYHAVLEYRKKNPEKAVMYSFDEHEEFGWAVFMAGGSMATIPVIADSAFLIDAAQMDPVELPENPEYQYAIGNEQVGYILYNNSSKSMVLEKARIDGSTGTYFIDPETGRFIENKISFDTSGLISIPNPEKRPMVVWVKKSSFNVKSK
jgi:hypothetical protein